MTRFCGPEQKLLPKAGWMVVLSAPKKKSAASIVTLISKFYEDRSSSPTNPDAFPASGCRRDKNQADRKRRIGPQILPNPLLRGSDAHPSQIQSGAGRKPALCPDCRVSGCAWNSRAENLFP